MKVENESEPAMKQWKLKKKYVQGKNRQYHK